MQVELFYSFDKDKTMLRTLEEVTIIVDNETFTIPEGFECDAASIPKFFWRIEQPINAKYLSAFVLHDWCYSSHCVSRKKADKILYELLREAGMSWIKAKAIYRVVRLCGGSHW